MKEVAKTVVIPVYKQNITSQELRSLNQCLRILGKHQITFVAPQGLDLAFYLIAASEMQLSPNVIRLPIYFFENIDGYNRLMVSEDFYVQFTSYDYILIYQLDCFVFKDELDYWCSLKYDYIGAPWVLNDVSKHIYQRIKLQVKKKLHLWLNRPNCWVLNELAVGNGGFSLRNPKRLLKVLKIFKGSKRLQNYLEPIDYHYNEDMFWSFEVNRYYPYIRKPGWGKALQFSIEINPELCFKLNNGELPFGCHAYERYDYDFWKLIIDNETVL